MAYPQKVQYLFATVQFKILPAVSSRQPVRGNPVSVARTVNIGETQDEAFRWDGTPPVTAITELSGDPACDGWYLSNVQAQWEALDATTAVSVTYWRLDGGGWQLLEQPSFTVSGEGEHIVEFYSVDVLGNAETPRL